MPGQEFEPQLFQVNPDNRSDVLEQIHGTTHYSTADTQIQRRFDEIPDDALTRYLMEFHPQQTSITDWVEGDSR